MPPERPHARYSPSSLKMYQSCAHYVAEESDPHPNTISGTYCHYGLETWDLSGLATHEVIFCLRCLRYLKKHFGIKFAIGKRSKRVTVLDWNGWEATIEPHVIPHEPDCAGYPDLVLRKGNVIAIIDYKFGKWFQGAAKTNLQGLTYLSGLWVPKHRGEVHFLYPRRKEATNYREFNDDDIDSHRKEMTRIVTNAKKVDNGDLDAPPPRYNVDVCRFCALKKECQEFKMHGTRVRANCVSHRDSEVENLVPRRSRSRRNVATTNKKTN